MENWKVICTLFVLALQSVTIIILTIKASEAKYSEVWEERRANEAQQEAQRSHERYLNELRSREEAQRIVDALIRQHGKPVGDKSKSLTHRYMINGELVEKTLVRAASPEVV